MSFYRPEEILDQAIKSGKRKALISLHRRIVLGFLAGAYISFGFLLYIRVTAQASEHIWGALSSFLGAALFPLGLIFVIVAGGELLTGNMMALTTAFLQKEIKMKFVITNWVLICICNFLGAIFVSYVFGHFLGLTETEPYLEQTVNVAHSKISESPLRTFVSGIGANWLVCLAVWLAYAAKDITGKILGIWFPIMAFVAIGFQHVVANMFIIPAALFAGYFTWSQYLINFSFVLLGNLIGGAIFVAGFYWLAYRSE